MTDPKRHGPTGLFGFTIVWFGQCVSMIGTGMTQFAITIWAYQLTGQATALALVGFFAFAPVILFSPLAGAIVDRVPRKVVMIASDLAAGLSTVTLLILHLTGHLQLWHLFVTGFLAGAFGSFQFPAYSAAISLMMEKKHYARANAMLGLAEAASGIIAPMLAGGLLLLIGIRGIFAIDIVTFVVAIGALLCVSIPEPDRAQREMTQSSLWQDSLFGFRYIFANRSLLGLQLVFFASNLIATFGFTVFAPMILARTGNNSLALGTVQMAFGIGGVAGGLGVTAWGGFKRKVHGVLLGMAFSSLVGTVVLGVAQSVPVWMAGAVATALVLPLDQWVEPGDLAGQSAAAAPGARLCHEAAHRADLGTACHAGRGPARRSSVRANDGIGKPYCRSAGTRRRKRTRVGHGVHARHRRHFGNGGWASRLPLPRREERRDASPRPRRGACRGAGERFSLAAAAV